VDERSRLRAEYEDRKRRYGGSDIYSWLSPANLFAIHQRQRAVLTALKKKGRVRLAELLIFEMGCGAGGVLAEYLDFGALPEKLHGVDLLFDRLLHAHRILPTAGIAHADGQALPFPSASFDLVLQCTALSSVLDADLRQKICADMLRILKRDGMILWYDFWLNPFNPQTRGIGPAEIRDLFPGCTFEFHKITLAPPLARRIVPFSWALALFLEGLRIFNTHYLVVILPKRASTL
jgi:SAM-dependent methyltransferase